MGRDPDEIEADGVDLVWHSAPPGYRTGFGEQTALVVNSALGDGIRVVLSSIEGPRGEFPALPTFLAPNLSGSELKRNALRAFRGSGRRPRALAFTSLELLADDPCAGIDLACWMPFNFNPPPPKLLWYFSQRETTRVISLTRWAREALGAAGVESVHIPHGVNRRVFCPNGADREERRARWGLDSDAFVVGMVAANNEWFGNRKSFPEVFAAFARFQSRRDNAYLYVHSDLTGKILGGLNLRAILESTGVPSDRVLSTAATDYERGITPPAMASLMRAFDVLAAPSAGEGFGIPVIEAQASGVPVIVSNWAGQAELVGAGWAVGGQARWADWVQSWQFTPSIPAIVDALEEAYAAPRPPSPQAVEFTDAYDHDLVYRTLWRPFFDDWLGEGS